MGIGSWPTVDNGKTMIEVILVAPNVSGQFGGESIKALQTYEALALRGVEVHQITHERVQ
jgi:hypothetical protein